MLNYSNHNDKANIFNCQHLNWKCCAGGGSEIELMEHVDYLYSLIIYNNF